MRAYVGCHGGILWIKQSYSSMGSFIEKSNIEMDISVLYMEKCNSVTTSKCHNSKKNTALPLECE